MGPAVLQLGRSWGDQRTWGPSGESSCFGSEGQAIQKLGDRQDGRAVAVTAVTTAALSTAGLFWLLFPTAGYKRSGATAPCPTRNLHITQRWPDTGALRGQEGQKAVLTAEAPRQELGFSVSSCRVNIKHVLRYPNYMLQTALLHIQGPERKGGKGCHVPGEDTARAAR